MATDSPVPDETKGAHEGAPSTTPEPHVAPTTPGWKVLVEAAQAVLSESATHVEMDQFLLQLLARRDELIPLDHLAEVTNAIAGAACKAYPLDWGNTVCSFLKSQIGIAGVGELLKDSGYELVICPCKGTSCIGFEVINQNPPLDLVIEMLMNSLFGPDVRVIRLGG